MRSIRYLLIWEERAGSLNEARSALGDLLFPTLSGAPFEGEILLTPVKKANVFLVAPRDGVFDLEKAM